MAELFGGLLWHGGIVFLRVAALVSVLPAFGERAVPVRVRLAMAVAFTAIVAPAVPPATPPGDILGYGGLALLESAIGLGLGISIRLFILALQTGGTIAAQSTSLSQILGAANADPSPAMGHLLVMGGLALAVMTGLHVRAAEFLLLSYDLFPIGLRPDAQAVSAWGLSRVAEAFSLAFLLAAPFVIASFIYNLALGVINRAMPQLMVAFVGAPAITWGGMVLLLVAAPVLLGVWIREMHAFFGSGGGLLP
ncbi:flagellar biosynthesis protein FliR [Marinibacterium profundimaris]|uniref:Flagellar biosynthesis protein FliR n=1 Tax=Marinibacterium profundimaris TaxID=1679460 RepID=A0A225NT00_9RHOB|nr:flagellar biosynthesis protein FliR [Marinibacterium profundimaris]